MHYLDNAATTAVLPQVADCVGNILKSHWANPSQTYKIGVDAEGLISCARKQISTVLNCKNNEIYFTASGTEANNIALWGACAGRRAWANNIVATAYEHPSVLKPLEEIAHRYSFNLTLVPPDKNGNVDINALASAVNQKTALVTSMHVNNETGAIIDVAALGKMVKEKNKRTAFHVDGIQAFCKLPIKLSACNIDTYSISGHKICAPKGIGALYVRNGFPLVPLMQGGGQENGIRPGTENTAYISAFGLAAEIMAKKEDKTKSLHEYLLANFSRIGGIKVNSPKNSICGIVNISLPNINGETMMNYLAQKEIYVSMGSACSGKSPSHTLSAMGFALPDAQKALRISFNQYNSKEDIDALCNELKRGIKELQKT